MDKDGHVDGSRGDHVQESNCADCQRPDSAEDMVQCDQCDVWKHYTCAGVNDSVASRSFVCGNCTARQSAVDRSTADQSAIDLISVRSGSSRTSTTSAFSICLSQLVERQKLERVRVELELQRRHLDEQQQLIDKVVDGEETASHRSGGLPSGAKGAANNELAPPSSKALPTPPPPGAPLASAAGRSKQSTVETTDATEPLMVTIPFSALDSSTVESLKLRKNPLDAFRNRVEQCEIRANPTPEQEDSSVVVSIPLSALDPRTVESLKARKDPQTALRELRNRVEQCEHRANPTPEELADLRAQVEICRTLLEGFQTSAEPSKAARRPETSNLRQAKLQYLTPAANSTRVDKQTGAIPKASRTLPVVVENELNFSLAGAVGGIDTSKDIWPLKMPASQTSCAPVSQSIAALETRPIDAGPSGKRQALNNSVNTNEYSSNNCPTTNNPTTREQPRFDARPGESHSLLTNSHEQPRESFARSGDATLFSSQFEQNSTHLQTRNLHSRAVDSSLPPRHLSNSQAIPHPDPVRPTQQQLAARQSLAKELPRFTGDPTEWPIFISNYRYTTDACGYTDGENMLRLQRSLSGPALETVRCRLVLPAAVPQVIETLRLRFGRPELLINALLRKVREIPAPKSDRLEGLIDFGMAVQALCDHIEAANERAHLSNPSLLQELVAKLPADQRMMWAGYKRGFQDVNLRTFGDYMAAVVRDATSVTTFEPEQKRINARDRPKHKGFVNSHATETAGTRDSSHDSKETPKQFNCAHCNKSGHRLRDCNAFTQLKVDDRWRRIRELKLCQSCLFSHGRRACRIRKVCEIDGCQYSHHKLLHSSAGPPKPSAPQIQVAEHHTHRQPTSSTLFRIIPVTLHGVSGSIDTFAFLDEGSDMTLVENDLVTSLGIQGTPLPLCLRWTGNTSRTEKGSQQVTIEIAGMGQKKRHKLLNARTVNNLGLPSQTFRMDEAERIHQHLKGIPVSSYENVVPRILIGIDNLRLAVPLKVREGEGTAPVAVKTRLGWCVYGPQGCNNRESYSFHICECSCDDTLHEAVKEFFAVEAAGAGPVDIPLTLEEERALTTLEQTTRRVGNRFETGLIWKQDNVEFPDSYSMAVRRLECLERRMDRNPELKENLHRQVSEYEAKGYAHKTTKAEMKAADPRRVWYLPVGAVINPKKPGKIRVIWDAAAKVDGVSLNSQLLKGPDQLSSLPAVLFRFRQYGVAVSSDIQEMFHQIRIREEDKHSQRFLWRAKPSDEPTVYLMDVATFGSTCSPASAQFVKNLNAEQHREQYPEAASAIIDDHYVDDYLTSFGSEEEAAKVARDVRHVHGNGGFKLHNWRSNSSRVLEQLDEVQSEADKVLNLVDGGKSERVLGMLWSPSADELSFSTQLSEEVQTLIQTGTRPTKRQVLRCVMTLFDPLGLLSPFIIHGRVLIQDLWREGMEWDEQISDDVNKKWKRWIQMIGYIAEIRIPRCYFHQATRETYQNSEYHVFVDASGEAYSCAIYLRTIDDRGEPRCCLVAAKSKVAPIKPWSIPKLELQGCVLGVRWSKFVKENHSLPISKMVFWCDATVPLGWIKADPRNYRQFVSFRVGEILEHTTANQWRWVPSKDNPADEATKWGSGPYFDPESKWFHGPTFLRLPETEWPRPKQRATAPTEEMRASILHHCSFVPVIDFERFSSWDRLQRATAYALRFLHNSAKRQPKFTGQLLQAELRAAEEVILKLVQLECYPDEIAALSNKVPNEIDQEAIGKESSIYRLMPMLDNVGVLRERGRISAAKDVCYNVQHPVILPRNHRVTELLVHHFHQRYRHGNAETVVNELRQLYTIPRLRLVVKQVTRDCALCKVRRARPAIPPMAPLPLARVAHHERAFTYTGVDYFGPLLVKQGRSNVKRWIALFTCLTVRAVHLEVAYSLSTESCISCVRRFVGRRGSPAEFFSDNGTNFQGADRVLRHQISQGLSNTFTNANTKWNFIPPGAPHMGGAWERLVRSVKAAMGEAYSEGKLDDEGLQTLVVEAESM
ncbi:uncharacterized protein LOC134284792, partial [Aedes albopictus]|uniref:Endonuclease n=2 Tax=Aedes albopictus TaxID=7160 RepID=A0ABM1YQ96_AEDAL